MKLEVNQPYNDSSENCETPVLGWETDCACGQGEKSKDNGVSQPYTDNKKQCETLTLRSRKTAQANRERHRWTSESNSVAAVPRGCAVGWGRRRVCSLLQVLTTTCVLARGTADGTTGRTFQKAKDKMDPTQKDKYRCWSLHSSR